jgi:hypothetical protein
LDPQTQSVWRAPPLLLAGRAGSSTAWRSPPLLCPPSALWILAVSHRERPDKGLYDLIHAVQSGLLPPSRTGWLVPLSAPNCTAADKAAVPLPNPAHLSCRPPCPLCRAVRRPTVVVVPTLTSLFPRLGVQAAKRRAPGVQLLKATLLFLLGIFVPTNLWLAPTHILQLT